MIWKEKSLHWLEIARPPCLVEEWLERAIEANQHVVALARHGLDPVALLAFRCPRAEPHRVRAVGIGLHGGIQAVEAGEFLVGLKPRAVLAVIDHERPEILGRNRSRQCDRAGLAAIEEVAVHVLRGDAVDRALTHLGFGHGRGDAGGVVVKKDAVIEHAFAVVVEGIVAATGEGGVPLAAGPDVVTRISRRKGNRAGRGVADGHPFGEELLHAGVGFEGLALFDADRGEKPDQFGIERVGRLILDDSVEFLKEVEIVGVDGVHLLAGEVDEALLGRIRCLIDTLS
jgi:hypothetical protein